MLTSLPDQSQTVRKRKRRSVRSASPSDDNQGYVDEDILFDMEKSAGQEKYNLDGMSIIKLLREPGLFPTRGIGVYASTEILRRTGKTDTGPVVCEH